MDEANKGNELEKVQKINSLHEELISLQNQGKQKAIEIGELLTTLGAELPHGEFDGWTKNNLAFSEIMARQYMGRFAKKDKELWNNFKF